MPRLDGFGLIEAIRTSRPKDSLAIIGVSAEDGGHIAKFLKIGANDFLVKPVQVEEFTCRVNQQLDMLDIIQDYKRMARVVWHWKRLFDRTYPVCHKNKMHFFV